MLDLMLAIRADEANHRDVNHLVPGRVEIKTSRRWRGCRRDVPKARGETWISAQAAGMKPGQINPFFDPEAKLDKMLLKYAHDILDKTPEDVKLRTMGPSGA